MRHQLLISKSVFFYLAFLIVHSPFVFSQSISLELTLPEQPECNDGILDLEIEEGYPPFEVDWYKNDILVKTEILPLGSSGTNSGAEDLVNAEGNSDAPTIYKVVVTDRICGTGEIETELTCECTDRCNFGSGNLQMADCNNGGIIEARLYCDGQIQGTYDNYVWSDGHVGWTRNRLKPGTYTVHYEEERFNCIYSETYMITGTEKVNMYVRKMKSPSCTSGECDGFVDVEMTGGYGNFTYLWSGMNVDDHNAQDATGICDSEDQLELLVQDFEVPGGEPCYSKRYIFNFCCCENTGDERYCWHGEDKRSLWINRKPNTQDKTIQIFIGGGVWRGADFPVGNYFYDAEIGPMGMGLNNVHFVTWRKMPEGTIVGHESHTFKVDEYGTYCVTVSDGCDEVTECFDIVDCKNHNINISEDIKHDCNNDGNGRISLSYNGGQPPYQQNWYQLPDEYTGRVNYRPYINNAVGGVYCVEVWDKTGCSVKECFEVKKPEPRYVSNPSCGTAMVCAGNIVPGTFVPREDLYECIFDQPQNCLIENCYCNGSLVKTTEHEPKKETRIISAINETCAEYNICPNGQILEKIREGTIKISKNWYLLEQFDPRCVPSPCCDVPNHSSGDCWGCFRVTTCQFPQEGPFTAPETKVIMYSRSQPDQFNNCTFPIIIPHLDENYQNKNREGDKKVESNEEESLTIYPNPFTSSLTLIHNSDPKLIQLKMLNLMGVEISIKNQVSLKEQKQIIVNTSELVPGVYFLSINDLNDNTINVFKLLKLD